MSNRLRHAAVTFALAAMMLRALLPMGWMPNPAGFAQSPLIICLMDLPATVADMSKAMDMKGGHSHGQQNSEPCPFAAASHLAPPALAVLPAEPAMAEAVLQSRALTPSVRGSAATFPQSPRAPPPFA